MKGSTEKTMDSACAVSAAFVFCPNLSSKASHLGSCQGKEDKGKRSRRKIKVRTRMRRIHECLQLVGSESRSTLFHVTQTPYLGSVRRQTVFRTSIARYYYWLILQRNCLLAKTSSPGTGFTLPERSSSSRRLATAFHLRSISGSGGFRDRSSESTTTVRSSTGSDRASFMISAVLGTVYLTLNS